MDPNALLESAEKNLKASKSFFTFDPSIKLERAAELYEQAANQFKIIKQYLLSANAFISAAECHIALKDNFSAATNYSNASNLYNKAGDSEKHCLYMKRAVEISLNSGNFDRAAKFCNVLAEYYEKTVFDLHEAINYYEKVAEYYDDNYSAKSKALLSVAYLSAQLGKYDRSIEIYEFIASTSPTKWSVKEYLFKAGLCRLCNGDSIAAQKAIEGYPNICPSFVDSREYKFLNSIVEFESVEEFSMAAYEYDKISTLDVWTVEMLTRIKKNLNSEGELC